MKDYGDKVIFLLDAVLAIKPGAEAEISGEDLSTIKWYDGNPTGITNEQIQTKYDELIAAEDAAVIQKPTDRANAKAKLIAGEALTEAEADTILN
jgi:hypothetical protein